MDDQPTDLSPEAEPAQSEAVDEGAEAPSRRPRRRRRRTPPSPSVETRAQRRARREAVLQEPVLPALATVRRPVAVVATIVLAALLVLALLADPVLLAAGLAWAGIVVAWGWPALLGSSSRFGSSLAIGVTGVLAPVAAVATTDEPYLRLVPVALVIGLAVMFGHQMVRRDGRPRLTESIGITSLGLAVVALGTTWMPLSRTDRASDIALHRLRRDRGRVAGRPRRRVREGAAVDAAARDAARRRRCAGRRRRWPGSPAPAPAALVGFLVRRGLARDPADAQRAARRHLGARPAVDRRGIPARARRGRLRPRARHRRLTALCDLAAQ